MKLARTAALICSALCCSFVWAEPAAWYLWRSPYADGSICSQISPGDGWVAVKGPYQDAGCKKTGVPH